MRGSRSIAVVTVIIVFGTRGVVATTRSQHKYDYSRNAKDRCADFRSASLFVVASAAAWFFGGTDFISVAVNAFPETVNFPTSPAPWPINLGVGSTENGIVVR